MAIRQLMLSKENSDECIVFDKKLNNVTDASLSKELSKENFKNTDSDLIIKLENDIQISDVIQIKINLSKTGTFLVSFKKEGLSEEQRIDLLKKLSDLKNKAIPSEQTQLEKATKILLILNEYNPIYVTFLNSLEIKINIEEIAKNNDWEYPLLNLTVPPKKSAFDFLKKINFFNKKYVKDIDFFLVALFALLTGVGLTTGIHQIMNDKASAYFMLILSIAFAGIIGYFSYFILIKKNKNKDKVIPFVVMIYNLIGIILGITIGLLVSQFILVGEEITFNLGANLLISSLSELLLTNGAIWLVYPINKIINKIKNK